MMLRLQLDLREDLWVSSYQRFRRARLAMQAGNRQVLLLFKKRGSRVTPSPHDGDGELHIAFALPASELPNWEAWLEENEITVEEKRTWDLGGQSVHFRDPDRHLLEIATPGVWSVY